MKRLVVSFLAAILIVALVAAIYLKKPQMGQVHSPPKSVILTKHLRLLNAELEEKLISYLTRKLGVYEGAFEIIDAVNLDTRGISGTEHILVTLKAPDGRLCQITLSRESLPWAEWELNPGNFSAVEIPQSTLLPDAGNAKWMQDLGITRNDVIRYYVAHPGIDPDNIESAFLDKETGIHALPSDWWKAVAAESRLMLEINKNKPIGFVSHMGTESSLNSYWVADYPLEYSGPGYRSYLYKKIKGDRR